MPSDKTYYDTIELNCRVYHDCGLEFFRDLHGKSPEQTNLLAARRIPFDETSFQTFVLREISLEIEPALPDFLAIHRASQKDEQNIYALLKANLVVRVNDKIFADVNRVGLLDRFRLREPTIINDRDDIQGTLRLADEYDGRKDKTPYRVKLLLHGELQG